jgi:hypothetical protein
MIGRGPERGERRVRQLQPALYVRCRCPLIGLVILASALLLTAAACGGDNGGNDKTGADASATPAEGTPGASQISDEVSKKLRDLGDEWAKASVKATYDIAKTTGTDTTKSSLVLYWALPKVRADFVGDVFGTTTETIVISTPDKTYVCSQEGGEQCLGYPPSSNLVDDLPFLSNFDPGAIGAGLSGLTSDVQIASSNEKVAGKDASCVSAEGNIGGQDGLVKWCFASNGLPLSYSSSDAAGTSEFMLQATDVGTVSDSDFNPPYPVTEVTPSPTATPTATPGG